MEWLSKSEIKYASYQEKEYKRKQYFKGVTLKKVCMSEDEPHIHLLATKVYYELTKLKSQGQIKYWVTNICGISTTYVRNMTKLEKVLFINVFLTFPPKMGKEI